MTSARVPATGIVFTEGSTTIKPGEFVVASAYPEIRLRVSDTAQPRYQCDCDVCKVPSGPTDDGPTLEEHAKIIGKRVLGLDRLTERETAIVLCALRKLQDESPKICPDHTDDGEESFVEHDEFESLCEKINFGGDGE